jgi:cytochrome c5
MKKVIYFFVVGISAGLLLSSCGSSKKADIVNGEAVYNRACIACHLMGVEGAAKLSDKPRWEAIAAKGMDVLLEHSIKGYTGDYGVMPEKGTCLNCTDKDLFDAIGYMMTQAGVQIPE